MQPLTTSSLPPLRRRIDPSSTETAPKETGPAVVSANSIISGEMPIVRVSSPISQTPSAHPETIESQIVAYLCLPKIQFSLSRLNLNDGSYSLRMSCSRSSPRCSTRFGKVSGIELCSKQRSWLSAISSSYCNDRTATADRACALRTGFCGFGSHNSGAAGDRP